MLARDLKVGDIVRYAKGTGVEFEVVGAGIVTVVLSPVDNPTVKLTSSPYFLEKVEYTCPIFLES